MDVALQWVALVVTGVLTFLGYLATRNSARAAEASLELSKLIYEQQQEEKMKASLLRKNHILNLMEKVLNALDVQKSGFFDVNAIKKSPLDYGLSKDELARYFDTDESELILEFWEKYILYVDTYWRNLSGWRESGFDYDNTTALGNETFVLYEQLIQIRNKVKDK